MPLDVADLGERVRKSLEAFLGRQTATLDAIADDLRPASDTLTAFLLDGGKRLRPAFCYWGWRGAGGADTDEAVNAAACLELLHACALVHDDVMDASDFRRGRPSVHRRFERLHRDRGWHGDAEAYGRAAAILLGDLCLVWSDQMFHDCGLPPEALQRGAHVFDAMRTEVMAGQYLDVLEQARAGGDVDRALRVARYKSAKYTVERPLHLGAALAGAGQPVVEAYTGYGIPLGEAFQLRDDVLGVFGDPGQMGKPAGDDLREGKRTVLIALAERHANPSQRRVIGTLFGRKDLNDQGVATLREIVRATGALDEVERLVAQRSDEAARAIHDAPIDPEAKAVLERLARAAVDRVV